MPRDEKKMAYVGGKARSSDHILAILNRPEFDGMAYLEPFVGYAHILRRVDNKYSYEASDVNKLLLSLLNGVKCGKKAPHIPREEYERLKTQHSDSSFRRAVAAFAYSYKGKEFTGYFNDRRERGRMYAEEHKRYYDKLHDNDIFQRTRLRSIDYRKLEPKDKLVYCDPPYRSTTGYNRDAEFDNDEFWQRMREWSRDNIVFISEYKAPRDFRCVSSCEKLSNLHPTGKPSMRIERVFAHESLVPHLSKILSAASRDSFRESKRKVQKSAKKTSLSKRANKRLNRRSQRRSRH